MSLRKCKYHSVKLDQLISRYRTGALLQDYRPLEGNQLKEFGVNTSLELMRSGPVPWLGLVVDIVRGEYKGQTGAVRDVNRYQVDPSRKPKSASGIMLTIERYIFTVIASTKLVKMDYDAVRFHK